jgi:hypothetical protein
VCSHGNVDQRCGQAGPELIQAIINHACKVSSSDFSAKKSSIEKPAQQQLNRKFSFNRLFVLPSGHIGGHKFAGNVIFYPQGDWFGCLQKTDIPSLLDQYFAPSTTTSVPKTQSSIPTYSSWKPQSAVIEVNNEQVNCTNCICDPCNNINIQKWRGRLGMTTLQQQQLAAQILESNELSSENIKLRFEIDKLL